MAFPFGGDDKKKHDWGVFSKFGLILVGIFGAYVMLPTITVWINTIVSRLTDFALNTGPKVALAAGVIGLLVRISPWHKKHGATLVWEGAFCTFGLALLPRAFVWLSGPAPALAMNVINAGGSILNAISTAFGSLSGLGG